MCPNIMSPAHPPYTQDYESMVDLAESIPDHNQIQKAPIQVQYAFALNRRNKEKDRDKALEILEKVTTLFKTITVQFCLGFSCPSGAMD